MPRLILLEGLWSVGKSSLLSRVAKFPNCIVFTEPQLHAQQNEDLSMAYWEWFIKRDQVIPKLMESGASYIVLERSWLSVLAFLSASGRVVEFSNLLDKGKTLQPLNCDRLIYLTSPVKEIHERICRNFETKYHRSTPLVLDVNFLKTYKTFLDSNLELLKAKNVIIEEFSRLLDATDYDLVSLLENV